MHRLLPAFLFLLPGGLVAQAATYTYINQKAPYANPIPPMLTASNLPRVGRTFSVWVPHSWSTLTAGTTRVHLLAFGVRNPDLPIRRLGGFLFSSAEIVLSVPTGPRNTMTTMSFPIPNSPQLLGVRFYQQVLGADVGPQPLPSHLSRGGVGTIGR